MKISGQNSLIITRFYSRLRGRALGATVIIVGNGIAVRVQILDEAVCISFHSNVHRKGMNLSPPQLWVNGWVD